MNLVVDTLVEGLLDEAVARQLITHCGYEPGNGYGKNGIDYLHVKASGFNARAAHGNPILMLVDFMDTELEWPTARQFLAAQPFLAPPVACGGARKSKAGCWLTVRAWPHFSAYLRH